KTSLSVLQKQRLKRLHKLSQQSSCGISLTEDAIPELLSLSSVKDALAKAGEEAAQVALKKHRSVLEELEASRMATAQKVVSLESRLEDLRKEISSAEVQQAETLASLDERVQQKFHEITHDARSFLATIAVLRAALGAPVNEPTSAQ